MRWHRIGMVIWVTLAITVIHGEMAVGQPRPYPTPKKFLVKIRYKFFAGRDQYVAQFDRMIRGLQQVGFEFFPRMIDLPPSIRENPSINSLTGRIDASNAIKLKDIPGVATVSLIPENYQLPAQAQQRVHVQLEIASGFSTSRQLELRDQLRALLRILGFVEDVGYSSRGYTGFPNTRLRGTIPVDQLETLQKDLRSQPTGWFSPKVPLSELPLPLRQVNPVRLVQVIADPNPPAPPPAPENRGAEVYEKIGSQLWELVKQNVPQTDPARVEIILAVTPPEDDPTWRIRLSKAAPNLEIEGKLGQVITAVFGTPYVNKVTGKTETYPVTIGKQVLAIARLESVSTIRLLPENPIGKTPAVPTLVDPLAVLAKTGLDKIHNQGGRGKGIRLALIDSDFRGYQSFVQNGRLPPTTRLVDLTTARNSNILPDPYSGDPNAVGHGTKCALAAALAAPEAEITLIRVDPRTPYMVRDVSRFLAGEKIISLSIENRYDEVVTETVELQRRQKEFRVERRLVLDLFLDESADRVRYEILGKVRPWLFTTREWHFLRAEEIEADLRAHARRRSRLAGLVRAFESLEGIDIVCCSINWKDGIPLGGRSVLSRTLTEQLEVPVLPKKLYSPIRWRYLQKNDPPIWFQSGGDLSGQAWNGLLQDSDANGVAEFASFRSKLPNGSWTPELNFLSWKPYLQPAQEYLPGNTKFRVSLQWPEPHHPDYFFQIGERQWYRRPLADLVMVVLRQRDPLNKVLAEDDFEVVAATPFYPDRLDNYPTSSTYEIHAEFTTSEPGRYAVQIEKPTSYKWLIVKDQESGGLRYEKLTDLVPTGIRPLGSPTLPALEKRWELQARLLAYVVSGAGLGNGRVQLKDYATPMGTIGVPGGARQLYTVSAADLNGSLRSYSSSGPPTNLPLFRSPQVLAYDQIPLVKAGQGQIGTTLAASFSGGTAAAILSAGMGPRSLRHYLNHINGKVFTVPSKR